MKTKRAKRTRRKECKKDKLILSLAEKLFIVSQHLARLSERKDKRDV